MIEPELHVDIVEKQALTTSDHKIITFWASNMNSLFNIGCIQVEISL